MDHARRLHVSDEEEEEEEEDENERLMMVKLFSNRGAFAEIPVSNLHWPRFYLCAPLLPVDNDNDDDDDYDDEDEDDDDNENATTMMKLVGWVWLSDRSVGRSLVQITLIFFHGGGTI